MEYGLWILTNVPDFDYCSGCYLSEKPVPESNDIVRHQPHHPFLAIKKSAPWSAIPDSIIAGIDSKDSCLKTLARHCFSPNTPGPEIEALKSLISNHSKELLHGSASGEDDCVPDNSQELLPGVPETIRAAALEYASKLTELSLRIKNPPKPIQYVAPFISPIPAD